MSVYSVVTLTHNETAADLGKIINCGDRIVSARGFSDWIKGAAAGAHSAKLELALGSVAANGTVTIDYSKIAADDVITIAGVGFTCKASGAAGDQFNKVTDATATAASLVTAINASTNLTCITATSALGVVTLTCKEKGITGNFLAIAKTENVSGSFTIHAMAHGSNGTTATINFGM